MARKNKSELESTKVYRVDEGELKEYDYQEEENQGAVEDWAHSDHNQNEYLDENDYPSRADLHFDDQPDSQQGEGKTLPRRAKYNSKMDRFLNRGIIIVGILLVVVLLIAFLF